VYTTSVWREKGREEMTGKSRLAENGEPKKA
jgi:hypothetical protein